MLVYFNQPLVENKTKDALSHINKFNLVQTMVSSMSISLKIRNYPFCVPFSLNQRATEPIL